MKTVNAQSRRVNSRRVGGVVHLEGLIWRGRRLAQRNPSEAVVRPSSSWAERSMFVADDVFSNGR